MYLEINKAEQGALYLKKGTDSRLSIQQLSTEVCRLIVQAEPQAKAKIHDIRKFAASTALAESMNLGKVIETIGWKTVNVFLKSYLFETQPLKTNVSLPYAQTRQPRVRTNSRS